MIVGDAPIAIARYRIATVAEGIFYTEIDRLGILESYRGQKYARKMIADILSDSQQCSNNLISAVLLSVPLESWIQIKLENLGWAVFTNRPIEARGPMNFFYMIYLANPS